MTVCGEAYTPEVVVETSGLTEEEWLEYRRQGIGGSDAAATLGVSPFATAWDVYYDKLKIASYADEDAGWVAKRTNTSKTCVEQILLDHKKII